MKYSHLFYAILFGYLILSAAEKEVQNSSFSSEKNTTISNSKQLTFVGPRSGEGYYSADGSKMIFQSEREPGNPYLCT